MISKYDLRGENDNSGLQRLVTLSYNFFKRSPWSGILLKTPQSKHMWNSEKKNILSVFFSFIIITNIWMPQNCTYIEDFTIFKFSWIFLIVKAVGFVLKLVTSKVICQHMIIIKFILFLI